MFNDWYAAKNLYLAYWKYMLTSVNVCCTHVQSLYEYTLWISRFLYVKVEKVFVFCTLFVMSLIIVHQNE